MTTIVIDLKRWAIIKRCQTIQQAEYWAEILIPEPNGYQLTGDENRYFSRFNAVELAMLWTSHYRVQMPSMPYDASIRAVGQAAREIAIDDTPLEKLKKQLGRPLPGFTLPPKPAPVPPRPTYTPGANPWASATPVAPVGALPAAAPAAPRVAGEENQRPKAGTTTGRVWELADARASTASDHVHTKAFKKAVVDQCVANGINQSTAGVQFGKWLKDRISSG